MQDFNNRPMLLSISRIMGGESKTMRITVQDDGSNSFIEVDLDLEHFAECLTGLAHTPCTGRSFRLANMGKEMEHKKISFPVPCSSYESRTTEISKECGKKYIEENMPNEGWIVDDNFNSQDSFYSEGKQNFARCIIRRWV